MISRPVIWGGGELRVIAEIEIANVFHLRASQTNRPYFIKIPIEEETNQSAFKLYILKAIRKRTISEFTHAAPLPF